MYRPHLKTRWFHENLRKGGVYQAEVWGKTKKEVVGEVALGQRNSLLQFIDQVKRGGSLGKKKNAGPAGSNPRSGSRGGFGIGKGTTRITSPPVA